MTIAAIVVLVVWCFWWIIRDDLRTRRDRSWQQHINSIVTDTRIYPGDTPIHDQLACDHFRRQLDHPDAATRIGEGA